MTTRYTDEEWVSIIADIERDLHIIERSRTSPAVGTTAFAQTIDHTLLKLEATPKQIDELCAEARVGQFATVCVRPHYVAQAATDLKGSGVRVATVIGFHEGTYGMEHKLHETRIAVEHGAHELDVVIDWPQLQKAQYNTIYNELATIRAAARPETVLLKLIIETSQLSRHDIVAACVIAGFASFDYVKTSTGFLGHGARVEDVRLMRAVCDTLRGKGMKRMNVKASGGIRTLKDAVAMLQAGASRLGTSGGVWIVKEGKEMVEGGNANEGANRPGMATRLFTDY